MIRVKTYKGENDKWYVEVVESDDAYGVVGERLNANDDIYNAIFERPAKDRDLGFASRDLARKYLKAYVDDTGRNVKGGLH